MSRNPGLGSLNPTKKYKEYKNGWLYLNGKQLTLPDNILKIIKLKDEKTYNKIIEKYKDLYQDKETEKELTLQQKVEYIKIYKELNIDYKTLFNMSYIEYRKIIKEDGLANNSLIKYNKVKQENITLDQHKRFFTETVKISSISNKYKLNNQWYINKIKDDYDMLYYWKTKQKIEDIQTELKALKNSQLTIWDQHLQDQKMQNLEKIKKIQKKHIEL